MAQAKDTVSKTEVSASVLKDALKVMQTLKIDKVHVTDDGYIFPKSCDARAYVGKDGSYTTLTKAACRPIPKKEGKEKKNKKEALDEAKKAVAGVLKDILQGESTTNDPLVDEHKKEE